MRLLLDGDIVAYTAAVSAETPVNWGDGLWTLHAYEQDVIAKIEDSIVGITSELEFDKIQVALSDINNFRKDVDPQYKANRQNIRRPMLLQFAKDYLFEKYDGLIYPNLEADDVLGIELTSDPDCVIWSTDKDLKTITGVHLVDGELTHIESQVSDYWFLYQTHNIQAYFLNLYLCLWRPGIDPLWSSYYLQYSVWTYPDFHQNP